MTEDKSNKFTGLNLVYKLLKYLGGLVGIVIGYIIGRTFGIVGLLVAGVYVFVLWKIYSYTKTHQFNSKLKSVIVWSNLLMFVIPPVIGVPIVVGALGIASHDINRKYKIIAFIGLGLALLNFVIGAYQGYMKPI